jgi:PAS domain S-box-containing protein
LDTRFKKINKQLTEYALGNFEKKLKTSTRLDEVDAFISCINMLGEELKETTISKNHFNNIFNSVSDMIFVLDQNGNVQNTSNTVHEILKYPAIKFKNKFIDTLEVKRDKSLFKYILTHLKSNRHPAEIETSFRTSKRKIIPVLCSASFLYNEKKIKTGFLVIAKDLTNIKAYEFSLKQSEEKYRKIFEESSDCIFISDSLGNFLEVNQAGVKLLKKTFAPSQVFNLLHLINKQGAIKYFKQEIKINKKIENFATQVKCFDGAIADYLISATAIVINKKTTGYRGIIKDITKQKETEKIVLKAIAQTQETERLRFAKDIHDSIGQQLSAIKFYIGTSVFNTQDENQKKILGKSNEALIKVLADMRNICFNLMPKTLESYGLVASVKELCKQSELHGELTFKLVAAQNFPLLTKPLEIAIFRIVQEFISNTIKHSGAKKIYIDLLANDKYATIVLKDEGIGFDVDDNTSKKGMGLKNVRSRVLPYNGDVFIYSAPGKGTKFKISIPLTLLNTA